ncbi:MAG: hypothetical protein QOF15_4044, partial [Mycobacterium sp.]|nr:hypothetical protein [Mycobacterium sp.]
MGTKSHTPATQTNKPRWVVGATTIIT